MRFEQVRQAASTSPLNSDLQSRVVVIRQTVYLPSLVGHGRNIASGILCRIVGGEPAVAVVSVGLLRGLDEERSNKPKRARAHVVGRTDCRVPSVLRHNARRKCEAARHRACPSPMFLIAKD